MFPLHVTNHDYCQKPCDLPKTLGIDDWDQPASFDYDAIMLKLRDVQACSPIVIIEGLFAFSHPPLVAEMHIRLFCEASMSILLQRRAQRMYPDGAEGTWVEPEGYWDNIAWPNFVKYCGWDTTERLLIVDTNSDVDITALLQKCALLQ